MSNLMAINGNIIGGLPIASENLKLLWENPSPTATFAPQTITLVSDDYDFLLVLYRYVSSSGEQLSKIFVKGSATRLDVSVPVSAGSRVYNRNIGAVSNTTLSVDECGYATGTTGYATDNDFCIPAAIYGIYKKSIANTEASKCMLSDGVTSVEDVIGRGSVSVSVSSSQTWATILSNIKAVMDPSKLRYCSCMVCNNTVYKIVALGGYGIFVNTTGYTDSDCYTLTFDFNTPYVVLYGISAGKSILTDSACQINGTLTIYY